MPAVLIGTLQLLSGSVTVQGGEGLRALYPRHGMRRLQREGCTAYRLRRPQEGRLALLLDHLRLKPCRARFGSIPELSFHCAAASLLLDPLLCCCFWTIYFLERAAARRPNPVGKPRGIFWVGSLTQGLGLNVSQWAAATYDSQLGGGGCPSDAAMAAGKEGEGGAICVTHVLCH